MILSCNSCNKKFVVPDNAISASGRLVQCSSCGNKWKQFPVKKELEIKKQPEIQPTQKKVINSTEVKKRKARKKKGPNLYSPEYLAKKHGIRIDDKLISNGKETTKKSKVSFGFYNYLFVSIIIIILALRLLYFSQEKIVEFQPILKIYIDYLFETIRNIKEIIKSFISNY